MNEFIRLTEITQSVKQIYAEACLPMSWVVSITVNNWLRS